MSAQLIYLDNAASSRLDERVLEAMKPFFFDVYSVATSEFGYSLGIEAREALEEARGTVAKALGAAPDEVVFTSGSTESSNIALKGVAMALQSKKGRHIVTSRIEDFPVLHSARSLEKQGFDVTYLDADDKGFVDMDQLRDSLTDATILVSIQHGNQEIGTLQDIETIGGICRERGVLFHSDATHSFARVPIDVDKVPADLITLSGHTIHGPTSIGGLYVRKGTPLAKWIDGGFQEFNLRAGLENIPGAVGFARAVTLVTPEENERIQAMRDHLMHRLLSEIAHTTLNGDALRRLPQNANVTFHFVEGESITLHLDMRGIAVSTGSACFSRSLEASHVITGIGGDHERAHGSIRFTPGRFNRMEEMDTVVDALAEVVGELRKISPLTGHDEGKE